MRRNLKHKLFFASAIALIVFYLNPSTYGYYISQGNAGDFWPFEYESVITQSDNITSQAQYSQLSVVGTDIQTGRLGNEHFIEIENAYHLYDNIEIEPSLIDYTYIHDEYDPKYNIEYFIPLPFDPSKPMVALTFDDGPGKNTEKILDILENYAVKATFCVIGRRIANYEDIIRRTSEAGHEIIGHSWDHTRYTILSRAGIERQILYTNDEIYRVTGVMPTFHRPPYGAMNYAVKSVSRELDMAILMWSVDPRDWETNATSERIFEHIMDNVFDGSILLFHDIHDVTVEAIEKIVPELIKRGYQLITVSELMSHSENPVEAGKVYRQR